MKIGVNSQASHKNIGFFSVITSLKINIHPYIKGHMLSSRVEHFVESIIRDMTRLSLKHGASTIVHPCL
ncbi:hypothetical protein [Candidatus Methanoperedens nitratireducens]|uniref:Uncharacterized protein n=1 Tax=Candidatus Methanoperedens nitratireducens TaxID=1392998 RepID=A0A284VJK3_9EURY|nr:hypothetical protein [Candidatus Methanoperedens nitroreducens]SNQ59387.1 hypothetical protein MNV_1180005 [Candidatus Methanoperedens nitroreducens]